MNGRSGPGRSRTAGVAMIAAVVVAMATAWPATVEAQRRGPRPPGERGALEGQAREVLEARIRARFGETVKRQLGLSDDEMVRLQATFREFEAGRRELSAEELELRQGLRPLLQPRGSVEELSEGEAREILGRLAEIRLREAELFRREQEALLEILTPAQLVRLYQLRQALTNRIRHLRGGGEGRPPMRGPPR